MGAGRRQSRGERLLFNVLRFADVPMSGGITFATLGMSDVELSLPSGKGVRQELLFCCHGAGQARRRGVRRRRG